MERIFQEMMLFFKGLFFSPDLEAFVQFDLYSVKSVLEGADLSVFFLLQGVDLQVLFFYEV